MSDPRIALWADTLTQYCTSVQAGDTVAIIGGVNAEPLLRAIYQAVLSAGGRPVLLPEFPELAPELLQFGDDNQLGWIAPIERFGRESADVLIRVSADTNTRAASEVDPARSQAFNRARTTLRQTFNDRAAAGKLRWTTTLYPTDAYAQDAEMSTGAYREFLFRACKLDQPDPAAAWAALRTSQQHLIDWLSPRQSMRIVGTGTDLTVSIGNRTWINSDGKRNFPSGEVFTGPVEDSANGVFHSSFPVIAGGREISGVRLRFADGAVFEASAEKNEEYLLKTLQTDAGASRLGEVAVGTNFGIDRFTRQILLDEKIGGTAHIALGSGYPETGSSNRSAIHLDLICDLRQGGYIEVDGEPLLVDGKFVVPQ